MIRNEMRRLFGRSLALAAAILASPCGAYEVDTHAQITFTAYDRSVLAQPEVPARFGIDRLDATQPFTVPLTISPYAQPRTAYLDLLATDWRSVSTPGSLPTALSVRRRPFDYERYQFAQGTTAAEQFRATPASPNAGIPNERRVKAWLMRGTVREDDLQASDYDDADEPSPDVDPYGDIKRPFQHFYDPVNDRALAVPLFSCAASDGGIPGGGCVKSTDWAFGVNNAASVAPSLPVSTRRNHFTWADAHEALMCALTYKSSGNGPAFDSGERRMCLATAFDSLGHVLHLLQDTAQPQHVRNDRHNPSPGGVFGAVLATGIPRRTYEIWTNYRATGGSEISSPRDEKGQFQSMFDSATTTPLALGVQYPTPRFTLPVKYFTTRHIDNTVTARRGLADFANRNFFSEGSLFSVDYPLPPSGPDDGLYAFANVATTTIAGFGIVTERIRRAPCTDALNGGTCGDAALTASGGLISLSRESIWAASKADATDRVITLDEYSTHADLLIPRAVAYSAGLIDYFFRGKIEIAVPDNKIVSVLDHGTPHFVDGAGYPRRTQGSTIFGFDHVRVKLRNQTAPIQDAGTANSIFQTLGSATAGAARVWAVARYHRNPCYQPDLSAERRVTYDGVLTEPSGCVNSTRTGYSEISVSAPLDVTLGQFGTGDSGSAFQQVSFDFSGDPIPVNATDLFLQVVYRGPLGDETDGIAVGSLDLREPTFVTFWNNTDYFNQNGAWIPFNNTFQRRTVVDFYLCVGGVGASVLVRHLDSGGTSPAMPIPVPAGYMRAGILTDGSNFSIRGSPTFLNPQPNPPVSTISIAFQGQIRQANKEVISGSVLPQSPCPTSPPLPAEYWCSDPMITRRSIVDGKTGAPIYVDNQGGAPSPPDSGALPAFASTSLTAGELRWELGEACPTF